ncbi:MAG: hypothetical protein ACI9DG_002160 [Oleispira sp.]
MNDKQALNDLSKNLAELDEKRRVGNDENAKLVLTLATVLLSFIAISLSKDAACGCLIKVAITFLGATIFLCLYQLYSNNVLLHKRVIGVISAAIQEEQSASAAWDRVKKVKLPNSLLLQKVPVLIFLTLGISLVSLIVRVFLII